MSAPNPNVCAFQSSSAKLRSLIDLVGVAATEGKVDGGTLAWTTELMLEQVEKMEDARFEKKPPQR